MQTRVIERDDDGIQIAELDVEATGELGSSSIRWVFECRDRPADGPAGVGWIEQLVTRRDRLQLDKMFAVSTTGFSEPAKRLAEQRGITLRSVVALSDIREDFKVQTVTFQWSEITQVGLIDVRTDNPAERGTENLAGARVRFAGDEEFVSFADFLDNRTEIVPLATDGTTERVYLTERPCEIEIGDRIVRVLRLRIPYTLRTRVQTSRAVVARLYAEGDREIGREGHFDFNVDGELIRARVQTFPGLTGDPTMRLIVDGDPLKRVQRLTLYGHN